MLSVYGSDVKQVGQFQISETPISMANPDKEWDRVMAAYKPRQLLEDAISTTLPNDQWEKVGRSGVVDKVTFFLLGLPKE